MSFSGQFSRDREGEQRRDDRRRHPQCLNHGLPRMSRMVLCHPIIRLIRDSDSVGKLFLAKSLVVGEKGQRFKRCSQGEEPWPCGKMLGSRFGGPANHRLKPLASRFRTCAWWTARPSPFASSARATRSGAAPVRVFVLSCSTIKMSSAR